MQGHPIEPRQFDLSACDSNRNNQRANRVPIDEQRLRTRLRPSSRRRPGRSGHDQRGHRRRSHDSRAESPVSRPRLSHRRVELRLRAEPGIGSKAKSSSAATWQPRPPPRCGWPAEDELLLYVIHGTLHLVGYDDQEPADAADAPRKRPLSGASSACGLTARPSRRPADRVTRQLLGEGNQP